MVVLSFSGTFELDKGGLWEEVEQVGDKVYGLEGSGEEYKSLRLFGLS